MVLQSFHDVLLLGCHRPILGKIELYPSSASGPSADWNIEEKYAMHKKLFYYDAIIITIQVSNLKETLTMQSFYFLCFLIFIVHRCNTMIQHLHFSFQFIYSKSLEGGFQEYYVVPKDFHNPISYWWSTNCYKCNEAKEWLVFLNRSTLKRYKVIKTFSWLMKSSFFNDILFVIYRLYHDRVEHVNKWNNASICSIDLPYLRPFMVGPPRNNSFYDLSAVFHVSL